MCAVCVCVCVCVDVVYEGMRSMCALRKVLANSTAAFILTHGSIPSDLSIQKMNNPLFVFFSPPVVSLFLSLSLTPPLLHLSLSLSLPLFQFSLSHNFFQSCCLTLPSSLKLCRGHNLELQPSSWNAINPDIPISVRLK